LDIHGYVFMGLPQDLIQEKKECSGFIVFCVLKFLQFTSSICTLGLSIQNMKPHGVGYITVSKNVLVNINSNHKPDLNIFCSVSWIWVFLSRFSPWLCPTYVKEMLALHKLYIFTLLQKLSIPCAVFTMWPLPCTLGSLPVGSLWRT
jgi:hypothetical protein